MVAQNIFFYVIAAAIDASADAVVTTRNVVRSARALVGGPKLLLADEPTGNLDSKTGVEIMNLFERLHSGGNTIILVTHEADVAAHAHRIVSIRDGQIEKDVKQAA